MLDVKPVPAVLRHQRRSHPDSVVLNGGIGGKRQTSAGFKRSENDALRQDGCAGRTVVGCGYELLSALIALSHLNS